MEGEKRQIRRRWWASAAYDSIGERSSGREGFRQDAIEWDSRVFRGKMGHLSCFQRQAVQERIVDAVTVLCEKVIRMGERKGMKTKLRLNSRALLGCKLPARCAESRFEDSVLGGTRWPDPARPRDEERRQGLWGWKNVKEGLSTQGVFKRMKPTRYLTTVSATGVKWGKPVHSWKGCRSLEREEDQAKCLRGKSKKRTSRIEAYT